MNICSVNDELVKLLTNREASNRVSREYRLEMKFCRIKVRVKQFRMGGMFSADHNDGDTAGQTYVLHHAHVSHHSLPTQR